MQQQLERLAKLNVDYRRKTALTQRRSQVLIQEKADLQAQLHDKEQQINQIKEHMVDAETPGSPPVSTGWPPPLELRELREKLFDFFQSGKTQGK